MHQIMISQQYPGMTESEIQWVSLTFSLLLAIHVLTLKVPVEMQQKTV